MSDQYNLNDWHLLADRFVWYDSKALSLIPEGVSNEEIQRYLYVFHGDNISIEEIKKWRANPVQNT